MNSACLPKLTSEVVANRHVFLIFKIISCGSTIAQSNESEIETCQRRF